jgi:glycine/D-amino acid oxidase-like deaminating enzyme
MNDVLIVGQGLAGTLLAHFLLERGLNVIIIDNGHKSSSSKVAAGIINPVTGRKYTKSWMIDELIKVATDTYSALEEKYSIPLIKYHNIIRTIHDVRSENNWYRRLGDSEYSEYLSDSPSIKEFEGYIYPPFSYGEIKKAMQVDLSTLLNKFRIHHHQIIIEEAFDFNKLKLNEDGAQYGQVTARKVIFCEGYKGMENPYFNYLPFEGAKGEVLIVKIPNFKPQKTLRHKIFIAPLKDDLFWVGAGYAWDLSDVNPTEKEKERLVGLLKEILKVPFEVVDHISGVRPSVADRRPMLGQHPHLGQLYVFNGLGTKGSSLGPFWANRMAEYLLSGATLSMEVNIKRYEERFTNQS